MVDFSPFVRRRRQRFAGLDAGVVVAFAAAPTIRNGDVTHDARHDSVGALLMRSRKGGPDVWLMKCASASAGDARGAVVNDVEPVSRARAGRAS